MARIFYLLLGSGGLSGGLKMTIRHVETLCELGFDAACYLPPGHRPPAGLEHSAPIVAGAPLGDGDVIVIPDDAAAAIETNIRVGDRAVIFSQGANSFATVASERLQRYPAGRLPPIMAVASDLARLVRRLHPDAEVTVVPCFADERRFRPAEKAAQIVCAPWKRPLEQASIQRMFARLHPRHAALPWHVVTRATEPMVASAFGAAALHLALPKLESVGITTLEAMASGCLCAGFLGVGGRAYATPDNGFWAPEDDCEAAADALAQAADVLAAGGRRLADMRAAARETAAAWSHARFRTSLEAAWERYAPEARKVRSTA